MSDVSVKHVNDLGYYEGPSAIPGIRFRHAARDLGVSAWGMNVLELAPHEKGYPEHDHTADGQEEVYVILGGSATLQAGDQIFLLETGMLVRVGPSVKRRFMAGAQGLTMLALGGTPGKAYAPRP
jgi:mannose-6-phosphate isomerase-like protein (cupin superfamily)